MPHGTHLTEAYYYGRLFFNPTKIDPAIQLNLPLILNRETKSMFERNNYYPADLFFFQIDGIHFFGRKTLSSDYVDGKTSYKKCSLLKPHMFIGLVLNQRTTEKGVVIFYKPLANPEKIFLFLKMSKNREVDISFPFPVMLNGKEFVQPNSVWDTTEELANVLSVGEEHFRRATLRLLSKYNMSNKKVYDPACSTGKFLGQIKEKFPNVFTIGQDANSDMIAYAKKHSNIDVLHLGNSIHPNIPNESVDFIFFRFLNASVVSSEEAIKLFCRLANCCKNDGLLVVFGFTPILINKEIFEILGLEVKQSIEYDSESFSLFQFYVLLKKQPVPMLRYEDLSTYNFQKDQDFRAAIDTVIDKAHELRLKSKL